MGTDQLQQYNDALLLCGERGLATLEEPREPRRLLDQAWLQAIDACLEEGQWWFATRTMRVEVDDTVSPPEFGYRNAFSKPVDYIQTCAVCTDEYFRTPLLRYADEMGYWWADIEPIYVQIVSNDVQYGADMGRWPASFCAYNAAYLAGRVITKLAGDRSDQRAHLFGPPGRPEDGWIEVCKRKAMSLAARTQPTKFPATGSWVNARRGTRGGRGPFGDGGTSGALTG